MFVLLILVGLVAAGIYSGINSAEREERQWPKVLGTFAVILVLIGFGTAWVFTLSWEQQAAFSWVLVMFGPLLVLCMACGVIATITEIVVRRRARRRAEGEDAPG